MSLFSSIGSPVGITLLSLVVVFLALQSGDFDLVKALVTAIVASLAAITLKQIIRRERPDTKYAESMHFKLYSFPSGHAFASLILLGILAYAAAVNLSFFIAIPLVLTLIIAIFLIGLSRVFLGAHYPSDVLGGWVISFVCLLVIIEYILRS